MVKLGRAWLLSIGVLAFMAVVMPISATAALANVSHAYYDNSSIGYGSLVSLNPNKSGYIEPANTGNGSRLTGVTLNAKDSLLAVNPSSDSVQVATTGNVDALVSTLNGSISVGDQISVSPFNGIGMKANPGLSIIGLSQTTLNDNSSGITKEKVLNKEGKETSIWVGYVSITINITSNNSGAGTSKLNSLQKLIQNITGHTVSTFRIVISLIVMAITLLALIAVIYAAIYGSIVSVGRNPLAKHEIYSTLRSVLFMTIVVGVVACITVYLLLN